MSFGGAVSLQGDRALIGAYFERTNNLQNAGSAYIFDYDGSTWI